MNRKLSVAFVGLVVLATFVVLFALPGGEETGISVSRNAQGAYSNGTWTGTYAEVMNATQDVFNLYGDFGTLLGQNVGNTLSATIQLFIYTLLVVMPFAVVLGLIATAVYMVRSSGERMKTR